MRANFKIDQPIASLGDERDRGRIRAAPVGQLGKRQCSMAVSARAMIFLLLACGLLTSAAATIYNVGGDGGWTFQTQTSTFYDDQFQGITLYTSVDGSPGDGLNFTFPVGLHNVAQVLPGDASSCSINPIGPVQYSTITIFPTTPGTLGFICGVPTHCSQFGMHLIVTFVSPESPAPSPSVAAAADGRGGYN